MSQPLLPTTHELSSFCNVSALEAGKIGLPEKYYIDDFDESAVHRCPSLAFHLQHSGTGKRILFDLGIPKDEDLIPPAAWKLVKEGGLTIEVAQDVSRSLQIGGLDPIDIDLIVLSHLHFDHWGDARPFTRATFLLGAGSVHRLQSGYPPNPESFCRRDCVPTDRTTFLDPLSAEWQPVGPFPRALDFFQDGSFWIVDAPGHLGGHLNALVRTDSGWLFLAGDTVHDERLLNGERHICVYEDGGSAHVDLEAAREHLARVQTLQRDYGVPVIFSHPQGWDERHPEAYFPGTIDASKALR
ncbi:Metallo-hydrolase/oxidoreductase [Auriculariales sp. MPI-PUGE-AT-0066]|nr:Metallo-hydrolase/oxidoreductase [Auriculariales sp. MPI-PUGE-AT-0066]